MPDPGSLLLPSQRKLEKIKKSFWALVHHVALEGLCLCFSPEWTYQILTLERAFHISASLKCSEWRVSGGAFRLLHSATSPLDAIQSDMVFDTRNDLLVSVHVVQTFLPDSCPDLCLSVLIYSKWNMSPAVVIATLKVPLYVSIFHSPLHFVYVTINPSGNELLREDLSFCADVRVSDAGGRSSPKHPTKQNKSAGSFNPF